MPRKRKVSNLKPWEELLIADGGSALEKWAMWQDRESPLSFFEFVYEDLGEPEFSEMQTHIAEVIVGAGGLKGDVDLFYLRGTRPLESILLLGKGSGKGFVAANIQLYNLYMLHWLPQVPTEFFDVSKSDELAIVIVATNKDQAGLTFRRIIHRLMNSKFFSRFPIEKSGKLQNPRTANMDLPPVRISMGLDGSGVAVFDSIQLTLKVVPSKNESFEGLTLIGWVMDEASGFTSDKGLENAQSIYDTLNTSVRELPYVGIVTSFPRRDKVSDFTYRKFLSVVGADEDDNPIREEHFDEESLRYAIRKKTWEVKPAKFYSGETFHFELPDLGISEEIPIEYKKQFYADPYNSVAKYMCIPVGYASKRFSVILANMPSKMFILEDTYPLIIAEQRIIYDRKRDIYLIRYVKDSVALTRPPLAGVEYFMGIDAGETNCRAVISVGHIAFAEEGKPYLMVDSTIVYAPDKNKKLLVDLSNFFQIVVVIARKLNIKRIKSDRWNTSAFRYAVDDWDNSPVNRDDYALAVQMMTSGMLKLVDQPESYEFINQMKSLIDKNERSKPHSTGYQDIADAVVGLVHITSEILKLDPRTMEGDDVYQNVMEELEQGRNLGVGTVGADPHEERILQQIQGVIPRGPSLGVGATPQMSPRRGPAVGGGFNDFPSHLDS